MTPRRSSRFTRPSVALSAAAVLTLTTLATAVSAPQTASAADALPAGSTLVLSGLSGSTPGRAQTGTATLTAPDDTVDRDLNTPGVQGDSDSEPDALADQVVRLGVNRGFFTNGAEERPAVVGANAGNLVELGTIIEEKTDANGQVSFQVGIERDPGFDDDGRVTATVSALAGSAIKQRSAEWSTANPLNGQVEVRLSPAERQQNAVAPAVSGDRTWYDVFTRDQFGNLVDGEPVYLDFAGKLDDFDYSEDFVTSDRAQEGDFWVVSFVPGDLTVTGTWDAPSYRYTNAAGAAAAGTKDVSGSAAASFYDVDFAASSFRLAPQTNGDATVGSTVTQLATVLDQRGNPVRGFEVQFFRFGPDAGGAEQRADRVTNAQGQASYSFLGADAGTAKVTAVVSDGVSSSTLVSEVRFRFPVHVVLSSTKGGGDIFKPKPKGKGKTKGKTKGGASDGLRIQATKVAAGASVSVYQVDGSTMTRVKAKDIRLEAKDSKPKRIGGRGIKLDDAGSATIVVRDRNGRRKTTYAVVVEPTTTTFGATSLAVTKR